MPLVSLTTSAYQQYLRPHLASFYSDWFLRYTSITRATATKTNEGTGDKEDTAEAASSSNTESKENQGKIDFCVNIVHINSNQRSRYQHVARDSRL